VFSKFNHVEMIDLLYLFLLGAFVSAIIVVTKKYHISFTAKGHEGSSVQSSHKLPTPRIGGIVILIVFGFGVFMTDEYELYSYVIIMGVSALPVFIGGLGEDIGLNVRPFFRLILSFAAAAAAGLLFEIWIVHTGIYAFDFFLTMPVLAALFTIFISGSLCHSINLIDGLHGLALGVSTIILLGLAFISANVGDELMVKICLGGVACISGLFIFNFPFGRLFLGDAGAYTIGHVITWIGIILLSRNPSVAPFSILLVLFWPMFEMTFSVLRRLLRGKSVGMPDRLHFHQLIMRGMEILWLGRHRRNIANPLASLVVIFLSSIPVFLAQLTIDANWVAVFFFIFFFVSFVLLYEFLKWFFQAH
jgi:UDP-GlcNAc:undecaprenyl-phosphate/decaprenyl-phosphate GlcNAc-1-phosphate transferase